MARKLSIAFTLLLALALVLAALGFSKGASAAPMPDMAEEDTTDGDLVKRSPPIPLDQIEILDIQYGGSGCPAGSAAWDLSEDKTGEFSSRTRLISTAMLTSDCASLSAEAP